MRRNNSQGLWFTFARNNQFLNWNQVNRAVPRSMEVKIRKKQKIALIFTRGFLSSFMRLDRTIFITNNVLFLLILFINFVHIKTIRCLIMPWVKVDIFVKLRKDLYFLLEWTVIELKYININKRKMCAAVTSTGQRTERS